MNRIVNLLVKEISGVDQPANRRKFILQKQVEKDTQNQEGGGNELSKLEELLKQVKEDLRDQITEEVEVIRGLNTELEKEMEELKKSKDESKDEDIMKSMPEEVQKNFEAMQKRIEAAEQAAKIERSNRRNVEFQKRAEQFKNVGEVKEIAELLHKASDLDEDYAQRLESIFSTAAERIAKSELCDETGLSNAGDVDSNPYTQIEKRTKEFQARHEGMNFETAMVKLLEQEPQLFNDYMKE